MKKPIFLFLCILAQIIILRCASTQKAIPGDPFPVFDEGTPPAYVGIGVSTDPRIEVARVQAHTRAMGELSINIFGTVNSELSDMITNDKDFKTFTTALNEVISTLPLPGKKFEETLRIGNEYWCRVYMAKSEVDKYLNEKLIEISKDILDETKNIIKKNLSNPDREIERDLQLLNRYHNKQKSF